MHRVVKDFIAFDLETTGFAPPCKIIEIGAVKVVNYQIVEKYQTFVNPGCRVPPHITGITGIDSNMVLRAPCIDEALPGFVSFIGSLPVAAHNASFDMKFIHYEAKKLGYLLKNEVIDTLALTRTFLPKLENHKLATVARYLGLVNEQEHRGLQDAMVVAGILLKLSAA